jgi:hypothetical protein
VQLARLGAKERSMGWEGIGVLVAAVVIYWLALGGAKASEVMEGIFDFFTFIFSPFTRFVKWMNACAETNESLYLRPVFWLWGMVGKILLAVLAICFLFAYLLGKLFKPFWLYIHH